jgi:hypothetical protein
MCHHGCIASTQGYVHCKLLHVCFILRRLVRALSSLCMRLAVQGRAQGRIFVDAHEALVSFLCA